MSAVSDELQPESPAWGRWGRDDEQGATNLIDALTVLGATRTVTQGRVYPLAQPLGPGTPMPQHRKRPERYMARDGGDYAAGARRPGGFQFAEDVVSFSSHSGTHVDALCHVWRDDLLYNGHPASSIRSTTGAQRCGVEKLPPVATRGVLLDLGQDPDDYHDARPFGAGDLEGAAKRAGVAITSGDAVLLYTGWMARAGADTPRYFATEPGLDVSGARWLADQGVVIVGADNYAIEAQPSAPGTAFPVHQLLLRERGIPVIENMVLDDLARAGVATFFFVAVPIPLVGSTASPVAPVAII
ncbi:MAG: cyclase family protein [Actinomycetota bacterium]|nr:cyclase family protein [Actinomycetota bacterium]